MKPRPTHANLAGSRYLALQRLARAQKRTTAELLQLYVLESFLRRLVRSRHDRTLVLKGGMLLAAFELRRATRDVDVLALKAGNDPDTVQRLIVDVTSVDVSDGVEFLQDTISAGVIREDDVYPGIRASLEARLVTARIKFSVDFNVGDPVVPSPIRTAIPVLLEDEPIEVLAYPKVMVVAERKRCRTSHHLLAISVNVVDHDVHELSAVKERAARRRSADESREVASLRVNIVQ